jgi:hypothetical protein
MGAKLDVVAELKQWRMYASINTRDISPSPLRSVMRLAVICTYVSTKSAPGFVETAVRQSFSELHSPVVMEGEI